MDLTDDLVLVPDHLIVWGDVDRTAADLGGRLGLEPVDGGVHPGHGTRNALFAMDEDRFLEVLGPDPGQPGRVWGPADGYVDGTLWWWVARSTVPLEAVRLRLGELGVATGEVTVGGRIRPSGERLEWETVDSDPTVYGEVLPFVDPLGLRSAGARSPAPLCPAAAGVDPPRCGPARRGRRGARPRGRGRGRGGDHPADRREPRGAGRRAGARDPVKALFFEEHGGPEVLRIGEVPTPEPGPDQALVKVEACSLNHHDVFTRRGMPGIDTPLPMVPGCDAAGVLAEVGDGVQGWSVGDRVLVDPLVGRTGMIGDTHWGSCAEFVLVGTDQLIALPDDVEAVTAACLPVAYGTAHRMLVTRGQVRDGESVLILGASGGVGTACVLLATMLGARVIAVASTRREMRRGCGTSAPTRRSTPRARTSWNTAGAPRGGCSPAAGTTWSSTSRGAPRGLPPSAARRWAGGCSRAGPPPGSILRPTFATSGPGSSTSAAPTAGPARTSPRCSRPCAPDGSRP